MAVISHQYISIHTFSHQTGAFFHNVDWSHSSWPSSLRRRFWGTCIHSGQKKLPSRNLLHSYWKWLFVLDLPTKNGGSFHSYVNVCQRITITNHESPLITIINHHYPCFSVEKNDVARGPPPGDVVFGKTSHLLSRFRRFAGSCAWPGIMWQVKPPKKRPKRHSSQFTSIYHDVGRISRLLDPLSFLGGAFPYQQTSRLMQPQKK